VLAHGRSRDQRSEVSRQATQLEIGVESLVLTFGVREREKPFDAAQDKRERRERVGHEAWSKSAHSSQLIGSLIIDQDSG
jgi:hypothetical protein